MKKLYFTIIILICLSTISFGQMSLNANNISNLNANSVNSRGWEVIGNNPANLGYNNRELSMNIGILPFLSIPSVELGNTSLSISLLNDNFFIGKELTTSNINTLLDAIPYEGLNGFFRLNQNILKISKGHFAFGLGIETFGELNLPKSLMDFGLKGVQFDETIDISDLDMQLIAYGNFSINYGNRIKHKKVTEYVKALYWGVGLDLLFGGIYQDIERMNGTIVSKMDGFDVTGDALAKVSSGDFGYGIDLGLSSEINDKISASISLQDVVSSIIWGSTGMDFIDGDAAMKIEYKYAIDLKSHEFFEDNLDSLLDEGIEKDTTYGISSFSTNIPASYNLSGSYKISEKFKVNAAIFGYFTSDYGLNKTPNVSTSINYNHVKWWPIIFGIGTSRNNQFAWSFGTGLKFSKYHLDFGISQYGGMFNWSKGFYLGIDQSFYF